MNYKMYFLLLFLLSPQFEIGTCVDLFFENPDSGFFLKPHKFSDSNTINGRQNPVLGPWSGLGDEGGVMDIERFTVLDPARPALIRATYGPFSTKQTVPARYALPEFPDDYDLINETKSAAQTFVTPSHQMDLSAHLVVKEVTRTRPSIRVLVHGGGARGHHSPHVCVTVIIKKDSDVLSASCTPAGAGETGGDATCLVSITIPARWWPPHTRVTAKLPKTTVTVSYLVITASGPEECTSRDGPGNLEAPRVTVQPETEVGEVSLTLDPEGYEEISTDPLVHVLIPKAPLHPGAIIHTPLYLHPPGNIPAIVLVIKCKVRNGTKIVGVESVNSAWNLTVEYKQRRSSASVTAMLIDSEPDNQTLHSLGLHEVFSWVLEIPADSKAGESKITWTLQYIMDALHHESYSTTGNGRKMNAKLIILKDITQAIVPISKSWSIVNTAVLTGRQVSRALKILSVSHAGNVGDVTLQSSCLCSDKAALKVSTSCTSVYLDGSEVRGSQNATIIATFSHFSGAASFTVWMPEVPLTVHLEDSKLSQIKGWKAPKLRSSHTYGMKLDDGLTSMRDHEGSACSILYQQAPVQVYGRFVAIDDNSGRKSYLLSRDAFLRVTELVTHMLRVEDPSIATFENQIIKGRSTGFTEIQVLSPIIGHVIGFKEIRVVNDKVWISCLHATIISGLSLSLQPDIKLTDGYDAITTVTPTLTAKYQEGLIDTWVELSDGTTIPLREMNPDNYVLRVRSLDSTVIAVAPSPKESQPRIIAIGHGEGELLEVSLELSEICGKQRPTLATTVVRVKVDLKSKVYEGLSFEEQHGKYSEKDPLAEKPIADAAVPQHHYTMPDIINQPAVQARMHPSNPTKVTPLEVGMYVLLAVFGMAIMVFATSFVVYSWRYKEGVIRMPLGTNSSLRRKTSVGHDSVTNAHDWVWLGRATLERASGIGTSPSSHAISTGNIPLCDLNRNTDQNPTWRNYHRFSRGMDKHAGSSDINITTNPGMEMEPLLNDEESQVCNSTTFTRSSSRSQRKVTFNNLSNQLNNGRTDIPPALPLRSVGINAVQKFRPLVRPENGAPPIPPHGMNLIDNPFETQKERTLTSQEQLIVQQKEEDVQEEESPPKFVEVNADDFVRLRGVTRSRAAQVRRATILENPLLSAVLPDNLNITDHLDNLPATMDYDQLLEYFSNLKETNA